MPRLKSKSEKAAGKLISSIQKEWGEEIDEKGSIQSEEVMNLAHGLLQARTSSEMQLLLNDKSIKGYLGTAWVREHPSVLPAIENLKQAMAQENA